MEKIDICIVATLRPELLKRTLQSFVNDLWKDYASVAKVYINVDKAGEDDPELRDHKCGEVKRIVLSYFEDAEFNFKEPHFPTAWLWGIQQSTAKYVFHLEEDWVLNYPHDFGKMIECHEKYPELVHLRLNQFINNGKATKMWGKFFANWNGDFFEIEERGIAPVGWCGHPSLNKGEWLRAAAEDINPDRNPEKQFHYYPPFVQKHVLERQYGIFQPQNAGRGITDIGRPWMKEHGYEKTGGVNVEWFTHWKKV